MQRRAHHLTDEHPEDVLSFLLAQESKGIQCALAMITDTIGGAVRAPGAIMAITETGDRSGYLSGGCIDADIALHAQAAIKSAEPKALQYGQGSPFLDIALPCGGGISISVIPTPDQQATRAALNALSNRKSATLIVPCGEAAFTATYIPKLRLRIAGRSADPIALASIAAASGIQTELWSTDPDCLQNANGVEGLATKSLDSFTNLPKTNDDPNTAFVLMMHDKDWEPALLQQALAGPAFYIGAVGSPNTHQSRCAALLEAGTSQSDIERIHAPIGLVPSLRDASTLAISSLAEIISKHREVSI